MMFCTRHNLLSRYLAGLIAFLISYAAVFKCVHLLGDVQAENVRVSLFHAQNPAPQLSSHSSVDAVATAALPPGAPCAVCAELAKMANHHLNPKRGTYTCPITKTQANPKFPWIVNGKKYMFCCPPCIAEFVKQAKTKPQSIKEPQAYIQN